MGSVSDNQICTSRQRRREVLEVLDETTAVLSFVKGIQLIVGPARRNFAGNPTKCLPPVAMILHLGHTLAAFGARLRVRS
jgi:hypothetical protein